MSTTGCSMAYAPQRCYSRFLESVAAAPVGSTVEITLDSIWSALLASLRRRNQWKYATTLSSSEWRVDRLTMMSRTIEVTRPGAISWIPNGVPARRHPREVTRRRAWIGCARCEEALSASKTVRVSKDARQKMDDVLFTRWRHIWYASARHREYGL